MLKDKIDEWEMVKEEGCGDKIEIHGVEFMVRQMRSESEGEVAVGNENEGEGDGEGMHNFVCFERKDCG